MILAVPFIFDAGGVPSKQKYHVIVGHDTVMAEATFFGLPDGQGLTQAGAQTDLMPCSTWLSSVNRPNILQPL